MTAFIMCKLAFTKIAISKPHHEDLDNGKHVSKTSIIGTSTSIFKNKNLTDRLDHFMSEMSFSCVLK